MAIIRSGHEFIRLVESCQSLASTNRHDERVVAMIAALGYIKAVERAARLLNLAACLKYGDEIMKHAWFFFLILMVSYTAYPVFADSTGTIMGMIIDKNTNTVALKATIKLKELNRRISLDTTYGLYEFWNIPAGSYTLVAEYLGFDCELADKVVIKPGSRTWLDLELASDSTGPLYFDIRKPLPPPALVAETSVSSNTMNKELAGTIMGIVADKHSGLPIPGARILISGTILGALVNPVDGKYKISNVSPGVYTLKCDCIGYRAEIKKDIRVRLASFTVCDFNLRYEVIRVGNIGHPDGPPRITKDVSKIARLDKTQIRALPYHSIDKVIGYIAK